MDIAEKDSLEQLVIMITMDIRQVKFEGLGKIILVTDCGVLCKLN